MNAALLLDAVGVPRDAFTQVFAIARSAGWLANALEQQKTGRMIRPASNYVGPARDMNQPRGGEVVVDLLEPLRRNAPEHRR